MMWEFHETETIGTSTSVDESDDSSSSDCTFDAGNVEDTFVPSSLSPQPNLSGTSSE